MSSFVAAINRRYVRLIYRLPCCDVDIRTHQRGASTPTGDTTMFTKIALMAAVAVVLLTSASATFAGPKDQRVPEPLYFQHATGEQG